MIKTNSGIASGVAMLVALGVVLCITVASCGGSGNRGGGTTAKDNTLVASIEPLRFVVEQIVGDDFDVAVLVPPGASPETYEPTPAQIRAVEDARLVFSTGLIGFENVVLGRLRVDDRIVDLSAGIETITAAPENSGHEGHSHSHGGVDPHIWVSPRGLARMARTAYERIHAQYPDSTSYTVNYELFTERLAILDSTVARRLHPQPVPNSQTSNPQSAAEQSDSPTRSFLIFHPGLTYYARDYGLRQIALETDGKEPSAKQLAETIALARAERITKILYQREFSRRTVEVVAAEIGAEPVEIDILGYDIVDNILKITELIAQ